MVTLILILVFAHYGSINQRREGKRIIKVGIIDGVSNNHFKFKIKKRSYISNTQEVDNHANVVWSVLTDGLKDKNIQCFEYSVINSDGVIDKRNLIKALDKAKSDHLNIINFSGGFYMDDFEIEQKVNGLVKSGVIFIAAAGNTPQEIADFPARMNNVISVGSKNSKGISSFSPIKKVDIFGKGEGVRYHGKVYNGTSFAAPYIANKIIAYSLNQDVSISEAKKEIVDFANQQGKDKKD